MNINGLSTLFDNLTTSATKSVQGVSSSSSQSKSLSGVSGSDSSTISGPGQFFSKMQQLSQQDPAEFKQIASQVAQTFTDAASKATGNDAQMLTQLADQFSQAAQTGTLQLPSPPDGSAAPDGPPPGPPPGAPPPDASQTDATSASSTSASASSTSSTSDASSSGSSTSSTSDSSSSASASGQTGSVSGHHHRHHRYASSSSNGGSGPSDAIQQAFAGAMNVLTQALQGSSQSVSASPSS
jgi:hypothetical protein